MSVSKEALRSYGNRLVGDLQVYLRSLHTHDVNNAIVVRARNALFRTLEEHFEEEPDTALHVQLLPEETFINGTLLPVAMADFGRILELTGQLRTIGVGEIVFLPGVTTDELSSFARAIFQCMHKRTPIDTRDFGQIRALELEYSAVGSAERDSHQVAIWLFTGLLDGLDGLEELVAEGHRPTMAPFMRHMRLLIDLGHEHRYVIQHLCLARRPAAGDGRHPLACRTFLVVSAGQQLGMTRSDLMAVGLASILDLVTHGTPPERMVAGSPTPVGLGSLRDDHPARPRADPHRPRGATRPAPRRCRSADVRGACRDAHDARCGPHRPGVGGRSRPSWSRASSVAR